MRRLFGTDGIRGVANEYPMTIETCLKLSHAIVKKFCNSEIEKAVVLIGKDTRLSGDMFEHALAASFCSLGVDVKLLGVVPTPAVSILTQHLSANLGIMISASHNPFFDNGIKIFNSSGLKLKDEEEAELEQMMEGSQHYSQKKIRNVVGRSYLSSSAISFYYDCVKNSFSFKKNEIAELKIVIDSANGSFSRIAPKMLREFGFDIVSLFDSPTGDNINDCCGVTYSQAISSAVLKNKADLGIAFDGDGDRVIICDENGDILDGDHILAVLVQSENLKNTEIVSTIMSNYGLEQYLKTKQIQLVKANVGDRYISECMQKSAAKLGGEPSGHIIIKDHALTGDGLFAALKILEYLVESKERCSSLGKIFDSYPSVSNNVKVLDKTIIFRPEIVEKVKKFEKQMAGRGKFILRPSGTEPVIRIFAEGEDISELQFMVDSLSNILGKTS